MTGFRPQLIYWQFDNGGQNGFADVVLPAEFPHVKSRFWNDPWAARIGLGSLAAKDREKHFARFVPLSGAQPKPLAMRYHGHQFRHYNEDLGDGRGFLLAQARDPIDLRLLDFGTKGSGQTPYSRAGDGRLTLKGAFREALATEMLESLGVNTSKTFSFFETDERLQRNDEPSPTRAAVLTRLSHGHIRFGTFERLAHLRESDRLRQLVAYSVQNYFQGLDPDNGVLFFREVLERTARLTAQWMMAGFVHGVLNTDNMNITGESFDYGPWRFLPTYKPEFTAAYFDHAGLYAYGRQPQAVYWNLDRLALALSTVYDTASLRTELLRFPDRFQHEALACFYGRMGLELPADLGQAEELFVAGMRLLATTQRPFENLFFDWYAGRSERAENWIGADEWKRLLAVNSPRSEASARLAGEYYRGPSPETMLIEEVESLWSEIDRSDNWQPFYDKVTRLREKGRGHGFGA